MELRIWSPFVHALPRRHAVLRLCRASGRVLQPATACNHIIAGANPPHRAPITARDPAATSATTMAGIGPPNSAPLPSSFDENA